MGFEITRLPPAGSPISAAAIRAVLSEPDPELTLRRGLAERLQGQPVSFYYSGREALRVAFQHFAKTTGRAEVIVPAYTCYSIPAAAVAAGTACPTGRRRARWEDRFRVLSQSASRARRSTGCQ